MHLDKIRFYINPDVSKTLFEMLPYFEILIGKNFNDLQYDMVEKNGLGIENSLLIMTLDHFETVVSHFQDSLNNLLHVGKNKILILGYIDTERVWRRLMRQKHGEYIRKLPNVFRTSDTPSPVNPETALSVHTPLITAIDQRGFHLIKKDTANRKNFFCLMNRQRPHRDELMMALKKHELFDEGFVLYHHCQTPEKFAGLRHQEQFLDLLDFNTADKDEWKDYKFNRYYNEYFLELVTETNFDFISPTEKIMKPIIAGMPFLVVGAPGLLKYMQNLGYKTYSEFFDESYNDETDMTKQCDQICNLIKELIKNDSLKKIYESSGHIADHNRRTLIRIKEEFCLQEFDNILKFIERI